MALLTAAGIADVSIALLRRALVLPRTATMISGGEFSGPNGSTITVRVPQPGSAREQSTPGAAITFDAINEIPVNVTLAHLYHGHLITDEEATLELEDYARQVLRIQVAAVATAAEDEMATVMSAITDSTAIEWGATASAADTKATILAAREFLGGNDAPLDNRWAAVSPTIATRLLSVDEFTRVDASGSDSALRQAVIGTLYGFTFVESNAIDDDTALFYHQSGFAFANRIPAPPRSDSADVSTASAGGVGLRGILQYMPGNLADASIISTFAGAAAVVEDDSDGTEARFVKVSTASS